MVEHTAHNGKNIGSTPIILKKFCQLIVLWVEKHTLIFY